MMRGIFSGYQREQAPRAPSPGSTLQNTRGEVNERLMPPSESAPESSAHSSSPNAHVRSMSGPVGLLAILYQRRSVVQTVVFCVSVAMRTLDFVDGDPRLVGRKPAVGIKFSGHVMGLACVGGVVLLSADHCALCLSL